MTEDVGRPAVVVIADDLIWGTRLAGYVRDAGGDARVARTLAALGPLLSGAALAIVDATAHAYEPLDAIRSVRAAGVRCVCVAQHDDATLRRAALDAGAERVVPYRLAFERGTSIVTEWLAASETAR